MSMSDLPTQVTLPFVFGVPPVPLGEMEYFFVVTCGSDQKMRCSGAYYLNEYELYFEDGCKDCPSDPNECPMSTGEGCPKTGWFYENLNFDDLPVYWEVMEDVVAFASPPSHDLLFFGFGAKWWLQQPIEELGLSTRTVNALKDAGRYKTVADLCNDTQSTILKWPGIGQKSLEAIKEALAERQLHLGMILDKDGGRA